MCAQQTRVLWNTDAQDRILYCERFLEFVVDLLAQLPTRRFFHALLADSQFIVTCKLSHLFAMRELADGKSDSGDGSAPAVDGPGKLFAQLVEQVNFYAHYEIDLETGAALSDNQLMTNYLAKMQNLQHVAFKFFPVRALLSAVHALRQVM